MKEERLKQMDEYIRQNEMCRLDALCEVFGISKVTVRRDIEELCKTDAFEKIYGGVRFRKKGIPPTIPYVQRDASNVNEKNHIGFLAASLVQDGDTIFIDSGTTTPYLIKHTAGKSINIITHSINAVEECRNLDNINIFVLGGEFNRLTNSFTGDNTTQSMSQYNISKAFIAATGISLTHGFSNSVPAETNIKKVALTSCAEKYIMIDHSKWDVVSLKTFAVINDITGVITDRRPPEKSMWHLKKNGIMVLYE